MTKLEIIEETVKYYRTHKRGKGSNDRCRYKSEVGNMCAVGRCMTNKAIENYGDFIGSFYSLIKETSLDYLFKKKYKGHSDFFWCELQEFHDNDYNWETDRKGYNTLTFGGENVLKELKKRFEK